LRNSVPGGNANAAEPETYGNYVDHSSYVDHSGGGDEEWNNEAEEDYYDRMDEGIREKPSRRPYYILAAIVALGVLGVGATFALKTSQTGPREIALIKADGNPSKVQPQAPAETDTSNQDASILQKNSGQTGQTAVALSNSAEQPVDLAQAQDKLPRVIALGGNKTDNVGTNSGIAASGAANVPVPAPPQAAQAQPLSIAALIEPKKVKTISVRPDGTILPNDTPPPIPASEAPIPVPRPSGASTAKSAATPKAAARVGTTPQPAGGEDQSNQVAANPVTGAAPSKTAQVADAQAGNGGNLAAENSSGFSVQLAAPPTEQEARAVQIKLLKQYSDVLSGQHSTIRRAGTADKPIFRIRVGTNLSREEATSLCVKVQSKGGNCFVAKN
jgi:hypothetical protein